MPRTSHTKATHTFEQWSQILRDRFLAIDGWREYASGMDFTQDCWRDLYDDGLSVDDVIAQEISAASE